MINLIYLITVAENGPYKLEDVILGYTSNYFIAEKLIYDHLSKNNLNVHVYKRNLNANSWDYYTDSSIFYKIQELKEIKEISDLNIKSK